MRSEVEFDMPESDAARAEALLRFLSWAEREAADLEAADAAMCIQIARATLMERDAPLH